MNSFLIQLHLDFLLTACALFWDNAISVCRAWIIAISITPYFPCPPPPPLRTNNSQNLQSQNQTEITYQPNRLVSRSNTPLLPISFFFLVYIYIYILPKIPIQNITRTKCNLWWGRNPNKREQNKTKQKKKRIERKKREKAQNGNDIWKSQVEKRK